MSDTFFIALLLGFLAFSGVEPGHAQAAKTCKVGLLSHALLSNC